PAVAVESVEAHCAKDVEVVSIGTYFPTIASPEAICPPSPNPLPLRRERERIPLPGVRRDSCRRRGTHRRDRRGVVGRAEDRGSGDESIGARPGDRAYVVDHHAAADLWPAVATATRQPRPL